MDVVLDSNVLFRTLISQGDILKVLFNPLLTISAPSKLKEEFIRNKVELVAKSYISPEQFDRLTELIFENIRFVPENEYESHISNALALLKGHTKDKDFVALSLRLNCKVWSYEERLFKIGVAISTKELADVVRVSGCEL